MSLLMLHSRPVNLPTLSHWKQACTTHTLIIAKSRCMLIITVLSVLISAPFRTPWSKIHLAQLWKHGRLHHTKSKHQHQPGHLNTFLMSHEWWIPSWWGFFFLSPANSSNRMYKETNVSISKILSPAFAPTDVQTGSCGDLWWCNTNAHMWSLWSMFGPQNQLYM